MKKTFIFIALSILFLGSCSDESSEKKECWVLETKTVTTIAPSLSGYPKTEYSTLELCDLTESEAQSRVSAPVTMTSNSGNYHITSTATTTKYRKSEYVPKTSTTTTTYSTGSRTVL